MKNIAIIIFLVILSSCNSNGSTETAEVAFEPSAYSGENEFVIYALETIAEGDFYKIDALRDVIQKEDIEPFVKTYNSNYPESVKNEYVNVLMDQNSEAIKPIMEDALNSKSYDVKASALAVLTGNPDIYSELYDDSGWVIEAKVDEAVDAYLQ